MNNTWKNITKVFEYLNENKILFKFKVEKDDHFHPNCERVDFNFEYGDNEYKIQFSNSVDRLYKNGNFIMYSSNGDFERFFERTIDKLNEETPLPVLYYKKER